MESRSACPRSPRDLLTYGSRVAHDLRTPLGGILTTTEMLREILSEDAPSHVALTQPLIDSADGLAALIERTSFFAKAISAVPAPEVFDMGAAFWNAYQRLEGQILKAGATLKHAHDWPRVYGQQTWTEVVWRNLITNALQHGGAGVQIEAGWNREADGPRFWIWDSGRVPEVRRASLFHPFHLLHHPGAPRGFGLAMIQRLIERQGGRCGYEAPSGGGSRFYFTLPEAESSPPIAAGRG